MQSGFDSELPLLCRPHVSLTLANVFRLVKNWTAVPTRQVMENLKNDKAIDFVWHLGDIGYMDDAFAHTPAK